MRAVNSSYSFDSKVTVTMSTQKPIWYPPIWVIGVTWMLAGLTILISVYLFEAFMFLCTLYLLYVCYFLSQGKSTHKVEKDASVTFTFDDFEFTISLNGDSYTYTGSAITLLLFDKNISRLTMEVDKRGYGYILTIPEQYVIHLLEDLSRISGREVTVLSD